MARIVVLWLALGAVPGVASRAQAQAPFQPLFTGVVIQGDVHGDGVGNLLIGDLDGDGHLDAVTSYSSNWLKSFLGAGDGTLTQRWAEYVYPLGGSVEHGPGLGLADFDEDGHLDLVFTPDSPSQSIAWRRGDGQGSFLSPSYLPAPGIVGLVRTADVDADGHEDIVLGVRLLGAFPGPAVSVLLGDGSGGFAAGSLVKLGLTWSPLGLSDLDLVDITGDGWPDMFAVIRNGPAVLARSAGGGTFQAPERLEFTAPVRSVALGDIDQDGDQDLAVGVQGRVFLLAGDGAGALDLRGSVELPGDGWPWRLDVVPLGSTQSPGLLVQHSNSSGQSMLFDLIRPAPGLKGGRVDVFPTGGLESVLAAADLDEDGRVDFVARGGSQMYGHPGAVFLAGDDGGPRGLVTSPLAPLSPSYPPEPNLVMLRDLDGDDVPDAVVVNGGARLDLHPGRPSGDFGPPTSIAIPSGTNPYEGSRPVIAGDFDGDGVEDLAVASWGGMTLPPVLLLGPLQVSVLRGLGGGSFASPQTTHVARWAGLGVFEPVRVDADGDGVDEIAALQSVDGRLSLVGRQPGGGFAVLASRPVPPGGRTYGARDVDGDGREEILLLLEGSASPRALWAVDWSAAGLAPPIELLALPQHGMGIVLDDVDDDGLLDALVGDVQSYYQVDGSLTFWKGRPGGGFDRAGWTRTFRQTIPTGALDLDGDGVRELVACLAGHAAGALGVWDAAPGNPLPSRGTYAAHRIGAELGDLDGDGCPDLVFPWVDSLITCFNLASGKH